MPPLASVFVLTEADAATLAALVRAGDVAHLGELIALRRPVAANGATDALVSGVSLASGSARLGASGLIALQIDERVTLFGLAVVSGACERGRSAQLVSLALAHRRLSQETHNFAVADALLAWHGLSVDQQSDT
jgi:hypothetical protein